MNRRSIARAGVAAAGVLAIAAGTAGAHPSSFGGADSFLGSALDVHTVYGHGADGLGRRAHSAAVARGGPGARRQGRQRAGVRRARPRRRRLGQGQLRLPDDVLRAGLRSRRRADRRHRRPGEPEGRRLHPEPRRHVLGRGLAGRDAEHAVVQGRPARLPERVVPGHDERRRRHLARRRDATRAAEEAGRGRRRLHRRPRRAEQAASRRPRRTRRTRRSPGSSRPRAKAGKVTSCSSTTWRSSTSTSSTSPTRASRSRSSRDATSTSSRRPARAGRTATPSSATTWSSSGSAAGTSC